MTIRESFRRHITNAFVHTVFTDKTPEVILKTLQTKVKGSDTITLVMEIDEILVEKIDETHDKVIIVFDDMEIEGVFTWRKATVTDGFIFLSYTMEIP